MNVRLGTSELGVLCALPKEPDLFAAYIALSSSADSGELVDQVCP